MRYAEAWNQRTGRMGKVRPVCTHFTQCYAAIS